MAISLSVVVIGKNEAKKLPLTIATLEKLRIDPDIDAEFLYVDSASVDTSVQIARDFFDQVLVLEQSSYLCAASGRFVGTVNAKKDWVLYLDGDMELCYEFIDQLKGTLNSDTSCRGYLGQYEHIYPDGSNKSDGYGPKNNYYINGEVVVKHFGGAVLLPRELVLKAGNYNPSVFSNEEIDLYTRIRAEGGKVVFVDVKMIRHHTDRFSKITKFVGYYWPTKFLGKKFYGFGQLLASRAKRGDLASLIKYYPYPFIYWGGLLAAGFAWLKGLSVVSVFIIVVMTIFTAKSKGMRFVILYPALLSQAIFGLGKYKDSFEPIVREKYQR